MFNSFIHTKVSKHDLCKTKCKSKSSLSFGHPLNLYLIKSIYSENYTLNKIDLHKNKVNICCLDKARFKYFQNNIVEINKF